MRRYPYKKKTSGHRFSKEDVVLEDIVLEEYGSDRNLL